MAPKAAKTAGKRAAKVPTKTPLKRAREAGLAPRKVTQSNDLIEASYSLTLNEKRLLLVAASRLDPRKPHNRNVAIKISAMDFADVFGINSRGHAYDALADAASRLYERSIRSIEKNKRGEALKERRWLTERAIYDDGTVSLEFNEGVLPYMTLLSERFTSYELRQVANLSSFYAIRLYELAFQYKLPGERYMTLEDLRDTLDVGEKYTSVKDFRRWVIDPSMAEISDTTDLKVEAEAVRQGRRVLGFLFKIEEKRQAALL